ncbi:MAG TPA: DUF72 domain-containing protein [Rhodothermales bacterium]|nr:DUF72 domain-containing protein [Rhodothermales bacterium]
MRRSIFIGTSGWHYQHWKGPFYPEGMQPRDFLSFYAEHFRTVEINNSFYKLPSLETMEAWRDTVPEDFVFAVKANRFITHMKKLRDPEQPLRNLYDRIKGLGEKRGPILFQLPPRWHFNPERLAHFLSCLAPDYRYAFEFRDPSWYDPRALELLERHGAAFCIYDLAGHESPIQVTAPFVYLRLHGPGETYQGLYTEEALQKWAHSIRGWTEQGLDVYCYFDNDQAGYAALNAGQFQAMVP